ncbi:hypothetical protein TIFTF001_027721 [Ficus carica]|uniref:Dof zinc finger protein n=1 Tax=Ficus carica TaxID=3494 RepID=A0AA88DNR0_FICCA|nr:hypothetical protein TIFTF001_027721 [Ficus carica]
MVFSSLPAYHHHHHHDPSNWQQQPNHPITGNISTTSTTTAAASVITSQQLLSPPLPPPPPPPSQPHGSGGAGSIRPGSLADRARMANIPMPEAAMKCPRCESTNTKFCYFNNYSLTQPRHFCKTCRRYWTRGGALRNVPVGGGCRRNKRSKGSSSGGGSSSKSSAATASGSSIPSNNAGTASAADILGLTQQLPAALRFMAPLHHHPLGGTDFSAAAAGDIGFNYGLNYGAADLNFHIGGGVASSLLSGIGGGVEQWRLPPPPQFPFLPAGLDPNSTATGLFEGHMGSGFSVRQKQQQPSSSSSSSAGITHQMAAVKMEDNNSISQGQMNLSRQLMLGMNNDDIHDQYNWSGGGNSSSTSAWNDVSGFSSSSTTSNQL